MNRIRSVKMRFSMIVVWLILALAFGLLIKPAFAPAALPVPSQPPVPAQEDIIRFHVVANSDDEEDQELKRAVRDELLKVVSPVLGASQSLEESRNLLKELGPQMEEIGRRVVAAWGKDYTVKTDYGIFAFPTKSYGSLVFPAGDYEAVRVLIGEARGANWWCVLFPPLCFVDVDHSTAVLAADGEGKATPAEKESNPPVVKFWIWEKLKDWF